MANETATLAAYVADLKFDDIPQEVLAPVEQRARLDDGAGICVEARR